MNPNTQTQVKQKFDPATLQPGQVNIGTLESPNIVNSVTPMTPKAQTTPINASIIGSTVPMQIPQVNTTSARDGLGAVVAGVVQPENTAIVETNPNATDTAPSSTDLRSRLAKLIGVQSGEGQRTSQLQEQQGLSDKQLKLNEINKQITTTSKGYDDQIKNLSKNGTGYNGGNQTAIADLTRQKNEDLANLAIIQSGANGDLQTAQNIIDSKIKAEFEPVSNEINSLEKLYNLTQSDLSESEKLQIQNQIDLKKGNAETLSKAKADAYKIALENGAPASVLKAIGESTTAEGAYTSVGSYGAKPLESDQKIVTINGKNYVQNKDGSFSDPVLPQSSQEQKQAQLAGLQEQVSTVNTLLNDKGLSAAVGPNFLGRSFVNTTGKRANFIASAQQLVEGLTLSNLIDAKAKGATFGALSEGELNLLAASASKIGTWAIKDKNGKVTGYSASEQDFKNELDKIGNFAKRDYVLKGGSPTNVGAETYPDGSVWTPNAQGNMVKIKSPEEKVSTPQNVSTTVVIPQESRLAYVNNNPGNLRFAGQSGAVQGEGGFAKFSTPEAGAEALQKQIALDAGRGLTIETFVNKYAPPSENDTKSYVKNVATALGLPANTPLSSVDLKKAAQIIARIESGSNIA